MSLKSDLEASHGSLDRALKLLDVEKKDLRGKLSKAYNAVVRAAGSTRTAMDIISKKVRRLEGEEHA